MWLKGGILHDFLHCIFEMYTYINHFKTTDLLVNMISEIWNSANRYRLSICILLHSLIRPLQSFPFILINFTSAIGAQIYHTPMDTRIYSNIACSAHMQILAFNKYSDLYSYINSFESVALTHIINHISKLNNYANEHETTYTFTTVLLLVHGILFSSLIFVG